MCKYCKKLKEIKDSNELSLTKLINSWRRRDYRACHLLGLCFQRMSCESVRSVLKQNFSDLEIDYLLKEIIDFINADVIGK